MTVPSTNLMAIIAVLSAQRLGTYTAACLGGSNEEAMELYGWNGEISAAFMLPLHICEVTVRNAVHEAFVAEHGENWPWNQGFLRSLPDPSVGYSPRADVINARKGKTSAGQVIPELKFMFWQKIFTRRHDTRLWNSHLLALFPNHQPGITIRELREDIYDSLEMIRLLRNRIAHHEPIFTRNLQDELLRIQHLLRCRNEDIADWLMHREAVSALFHSRPKLK